MSDKSRIGVTMDQQQQDEIQTITTSSSFYVFANANLSKVMSWINEYNMKQNETHNTIKTKQKACIIIMRQSAHNQIYHRVYTHDTMPQQTAQKLT